MNNLKNLKKDWKRLLDLVKIGLDSLEEQDLYERKKSGTEQSAD